MPRFWFPFETAPLHWKEDPLPSFAVVEWRVTSSKKRARIERSLSWLSHLTLLKRWTYISWNRCLLAASWPPPPASDIRHIMFRFTCEKRGRKKVEVLLNWRSPSCFSGLWLSVSEWVSDLHAHSARVRASLSILLAYISHFLLGQPSERPNT